MPTHYKIRESQPDDLSAIESFYPEAFPEEDLIPLVRELLADPAVALSLVADVNGQAVGHVIFTRCGVSASNVDAALLGPLAVAPAHQGQGIGTAIVQDGLACLRDAGVELVCVLGDPAYYGRFGFVGESSVEPPYTLPAEWDGAWQSQTLIDGATSCFGGLSVPPQWQKPELWLP